MEKKCFKCLRIKPLSDFYKHKGMSDGHLNKCKECNKFDVKKNRIDNIDYYVEYEKKRAMLPHRVEARKKYVKTVSGKKAVFKSTSKYRSENPKKYRAHTIVSNALKNGILKKPLCCENCSDDNKYIHGHHDDYNFPLIVRWLCPPCHKEWHDINGEGANG